MFFPMFGRDQQNSLLNILRTGASGKDFSAVERQNLGGLLRNIEPILKDRMVGNCAAVDAILTSRRTAGTGTHPASVGTPHATLIFTGPSGVGKSMLPQLLAELMLKNPIEARSAGGIVLASGSEEEREEVQEEIAYRLVQIDCSKLADPASLIGGSPEIEMWSRFISVAKHPNTIVSFTNYTADNAIVDEVLAPILQEGRLPSGDGMGIPFNRSIVVVEKSGQSVLSPEVIGFHSRATQPECNNLEAIVAKIGSYTDRYELVTFSPLSSTEAEQLVQIYFDMEVTETVRQQFPNCEVNITQAAITHLARLGVEQDLGATHLERTMRSHVSVPLSEELFRRWSIGPNTDKLRVTVDLDATHSTVSIEVSATDPNGESSE